MEVEVIVRVEGRGAVVHLGGVSLLQNLTKTQVTKQNGETYEELLADLRENGAEIDHLICPNLIDILPFFAFLDTMVVSSTTYP